MLIPFDISGLQIVSLFPKCNVETERDSGVSIANGDILRSNSRNHVVCPDKEVESVRMEVQHPA